MLYTESDLLVDRDLEDAVYRDVGRDSSPLLSALWRIENC